MKSVLTAGLALALTLGHAADAAEEQPLASFPPETAPRIAAWDAFADEIRDLPSRMLAKLPEEMQRDPRIQHEVARLALAAITNTSLEVLGSDPDHPAFVPQGNLALNVGQPNADTIYRAARIAPDGSYRIRGLRGDLPIVVIGQAGPFPVEEGWAPAKKPRVHHDVNALTVDAEGRFDVLLSPKRPAGYRGDWWRLEPGTARLVLRMVSADWGRERDPTFSIERVDRPVSRPRQDAARLEQQLRSLPKVAGFMALWFVDHAEQLRKEGYVNKLKPIDFSAIGGLAGQSYYEGAYELAEDEALIVEVEAPAKCVYRSLILTNEIFETTDWINNQSSLNGRQAKADEDNILRIVVAARDPGVANWLDTAGHERGVIQGRWTNCDDQPTPTVRKAALKDVRSLLPASTPTLTPEEREHQIRDRRAAYQQRPLW